MPKGPHDPCNFFDVYSEVQILERFLGDFRVCQIIDYGVEHDAFVLVLKHYKCNLRVWRQQHTCNNYCANNNQNSILIDEQQDSMLVEETSNGSLLKRLPLYLEIYGAVLQAVSNFTLQIKNKSMGIIVPKVNQYRFHYSVMSIIFFLFFIFF